MSFHILVVEDDPRWCDRFKRILEGMGHSINIANDDKKAKILLKETSYDLMLLDLCLNGNIPTADDQLFWETLKRGYPELPVVAITGWLVDRDKVFELAKSEALSFVEFIYKGNFDLEKFRQRIQNILSEYNPVSPPQSTVNEKMPTGLSFIKDEVVASSQTQLLKWLNEHFNEQELRTLCFEMNIEYSDLPDFGRVNKARELVEHCKRHDRLNELDEKIRSSRPFLSGRDSGK